MNTGILLKEAGSESFSTETSVVQEAILNNSRSAAMTKILEKYPQKS